MGSAENGGFDFGTQTLVFTLVSLITQLVYAQFEKQPGRVDRHEQHWGLCLPSSCTTSDTTDALNVVLNPLFEKHNIRARVKVEPKFCKVKEQNQYSFGFYVTV